MIKVAVDAMGRELCAGRDGSRSSGGCERKTWHSGASCGAGAGSCFQELSKHTHDKDQIQVVTPQKSLPLRSRR